MGFRRHDLQEAFFIPGTYDFRVWGYGTTDTLEEMLRPNYLQGARSLVHLGDLIYVSTRPGRDPVDGREVGETRAALVMVSGWHNGDASLRLVQDFGRPEGDGPGAANDGPSAATGSEMNAAVLPMANAAPQEPMKRGRGRPRGSRSTTAKG